MSLYANEIDIDPHRATIAPQGYSKVFLQGNSILGKEWTRRSIVDYKNRNTSFEAWLIADSPSTIMVYMLNHTTKECFYRRSAGSFRPTIACFGGPNMTRLPDMTIGGKWAVSRFRDKSVRQDWPEAESWVEMDSCSPIVIQEGGPYGEPDRLLMNQAVFGNVRTSVTDPSRFTPPSGCKPMPPQLTKPNLSSHWLHRYDSWKTAFEA